MKTKPTFKSAKLKIERANHHIADLERQLQAFIDSDPCVLASEAQADGTLKLKVRFRIALPADFALIIGDAIHNATTALDHLTWELIGCDGGDQHRQLKFPTGGDRQSFEGSCDGIKTPSKAVKDMFKATETFPGGKGEPLYVLTMRINTPSSHPLPRHLR